ncbi:MULTISPECIES: carbohydrate ABC transporter permease [Rhizobium]|uniref:Binding-protein-dependent transport system inner membrane protein n=1 Tax=Rhizobium favelukesii TaxID=348824 RepID=W6S0V0_9HYPH|nr:MULTISPECIES: sugar ABC transporter permease [Rhizobium]MCS0462707.1 sugar ABC transporter permease [Rhizobium favelukesii]UFS85014.1 sugar ABC transporter permease [Rhizobium sp. T136]CDM60106.1 binding-protein-dependent transport system inner membrane protein [Rhizobium favelukesii]
MAVVNDVPVSALAGVSINHNFTRAQTRAGLILVLPASVLIAALLIGPAIVVFILSFTDASLGLAAARFVGLGNYVRMLTDPGFAHSLRNTALYVLVVVPTSIGWGLLVALLIARSPFAALYRMAYFLPVAATLVALATAWEAILHPSLGFANSLLQLLGASPVRFLSDPATAIYALAAIGVWQMVGFNMTLFLAGLSTIPNELYEAAAIDGADRGVKRFLLVTWPMLAPVTLFVTVMTIIRAFSVFETVAVLTRGGPMKSTSVILYTFYEEGFRFFRVGYASAIAVSFFVFVTVLSLVQMRISERRARASAHGGQS